MDPVQLDENCPKCNSPLVMATTRTGKKLKKCSTAGWDSAAKQATGCDFVEWQKGETQELDEDCPKCGEKLIFMTTSNGKKMKKCSTSKWDPATRTASGCDHVEWINS